METASSTDPEEARRLSKLRELLVLDSGPEPAFDALAELASDICGTPIALITLIDEARQWFKANVGLPGVSQTPRDIAMCAHAIGSDRLMEVPDASLDERFRAFSTVTGEPHVRFYAGAPLVMPSGERIGTLCVIDRQPRRLNAGQARQLAKLADAAVQALRMRRALIEKSLTVRTCYERELQASQQFLYRTGRVAGVGGWELDLASGDLVWSDQTRAIHEVDSDFKPTLDNAIGFYAPEAKPVIEDAVRRSMRTGRPWDLELPLITATGRPIWVRAVGEAELQDGMPVRLVGAFQDITERRNLQQRVADSERFLRTITDSLPIHIAYVDSDLRYRFLNEAGCKGFGLPRERILGRTRGELTGGADDRALAPRMAAALDGQAQRVELEETCEGGARRFEIHMIPDATGDGSLRGFFCTGTDITERHAAAQALRELTAVLEHSTDYIVQTDWRGMIVYMNPACRAACGLAANEELRERHFNEFNTPETQRLFAGAIVPEVKAKGFWLGRTSAHLANRRVAPISHLVIGHRGAGGRIERYSSVMRDVSEQVQAEQELLRQTATLSSIAEAIPGVVAVVGADRRYRFVNAGFEHWIGKPRDTILGRGVREVLDDSSYNQSAPWIERSLAGETVTFERSFHHRGGERYLSMSYVPLRLACGRVDGFVGIGRDISHHKEEELRLKQLSQRDPLTGLLNRAGFEQSIERAIADGNGPALAVLYIDLDGFKPINDQHGHAVGDRVLQLFARRLQELVRPKDSVARLGGDEFAVLLDRMQRESDLQAVAEKLGSATRSPFSLDGKRLCVGASVGWAHGVDPKRGWHELMCRADARLYEVKHSRRLAAASAPSLSCDPALSEPKDKQH